jgi:hypothetical protein
MNKPNIPEPSHRKPSTEVPEARDPHLNALKGEAVGINDNRDPPIVSRSENDREAFDRANRGRFRRIF